MDFSRRRNISKLEGPSSTLIDVSTRDVSLTVFCESADVKTEHLQEAYDLYKDVGDARWMNLEEIKTLDKPANFVCDPFEGPIFDHLVGENLFVYGPLVLLRCLRDKRPLPIAQQPVYSQSMKDVVATFSSVTPAKRQILKERIEYMGGRVELALNNTVTHVICDEVGSKKYIVGTQRGLAIQTTEWVDSVWETVQHELRHAVSVAENFKTPIFANLTITTSGLSEAEKQEITEMVSENGGTYTGKLTKTNTHVILREAKGAKYKAAVSWQLHVVTPEWVKESVQKGCMIDPSQYQLVDPNATSTSTMNQSVLSVASTVASSKSVLSERTQNDQVYNEVLKLSKEDISAAGQILDGCSIHVFGIREKNLTERIEFIINQASALRADSFNDDVTHIITLPSSQGLSDLQRTIEQSFASPAVVLPSWLAACMRQKTLLPPDLFACPGFDLPCGDEITCMSVMSTKPPETPQPSCLTGKVFRLTEELRVQYLNTIHDLITLKEGIERLGGKIVDSVDEISKGTLYNVYANMLSSSLPEPTAITILHLESVIKQKRWVHLGDSPFYTVIHAPLKEPRKKIFESLVVTPTGFTEQEVHSLTRALGIYGGSLQAAMVKCSKPEKSLRGTTHLVCASNKQNSKLDAALRWKIPAVTLSWILSCAKENHLLSFRDFLVDKKQWDALPAEKKKSPRKSSTPELSPRKKMRPIDFETDTSNVTAEPSSRGSGDVSDKQTMNGTATDYGETNLSSATPNHSIRRMSAAATPASAANTPVLSSQRMREIYEEASRFKTPRNTKSSDTDSPGIPHIPAEKIAEMKQNIIESPVTYQMPEASFSERMSQANGGKSALPDRRPLDGLVALLDEESLGSVLLEIKMSIERLGGWICHTMERCSVVILGSGNLNDKSRALRVRAQKFEKPIVGAEWIYAVIDRMTLPPFEEFPSDYPTSVGPYIRKKTLKDYAPAFEDSDLEGSTRENTPSRRESTKSSRASPTPEEPRTPATKTPISELPASLGAPSVAESTPATPLGTTPRFASKKDPLRELIFRRSGVPSSPTPKSNRVIDEDAGSTGGLPSAKKTQRRMTSQDSTGSVLADIETQPDEGITYGGKTGVPTSTQVHNVCEDYVDPYFGDLSMVKNPDMFASPGQKRSYTEEQDSEVVVGKKFKKNKVVREDSPEEQSPPRVGEKPNFALYHLSEEESDRCTRIINSLGGTIVNDMSTDPCHDDHDLRMIIDSTNSKNFKKKSVLQQIAMGGWILDAFYLDKCEKANKFLPPEDYTMGAGTKGSKANDERFASWPRWRQLRVQNGTGAFDGWRVVLFGGSSEREKGHRRLLEAGGAKLLERDDIKDASHIFVKRGDTNTANQVYSVAPPTALVLANDYMLHYLAREDVNPDLFKVEAS